MTQFGKIQICGLWGGGGSAVNVAPVSAIMILVQILLSLML